MTAIPLALTSAGESIARKGVSRVAGAYIGAHCIRADVLTEVSSIVAFMDL